MLKGYNTRYSGPPTTVSSYMKEFAVECPKCRKEALVTQEQLTCKHCMFSEQAADLIRYKQTVKRNCDNCGKLIEVTIGDQKEKNPEIIVPCPHCGIERTYLAKTEEYRITYVRQGRASDPVFNLPLWFQADVRGNLFWAFNREHLSEIKAYVGSKLRERRTAEFATMVERLPNFIKHAKHRETLLKVIERLEKKTSEL
jgi:hypothetical protein